MELVQLQGLIAVQEEILAWHWASHELCVDEIMERNDPKLSREMESIQYAAVELMSRIEDVLSKHKDTLKPFDRSKLDRIYALKLEE